MTSLAFMLSGGVRADLHGRKYPVDVVYGPERLERAEGVSGGNTILFARDRRGSDIFGSPLGSRPNPNYQAALATAITCKIYAVSELEGARAEDHEGLAETFRDAVYTAIRQVVIAPPISAGLQPAYSEARFLSADELAKEEQWPGAVYLLRFSVLRAVVRVDWDGNGLPEGTVHRKIGRTEARYAGAPVDAEPVIGCNTLE